MIIAFDLDDVLAETLAACCSWYNKKYRAIHPEITSHTFTCWDMASCVPIGKAVYDFFRSPTMYDSVLPTHRAITLTQMLQERGDKVIIVTSTWQPVSAERWIKRYFHHIKEYHYVKDKLDFPADVLIDDRPDNLLGRQPQKMLYDRPHNRSTAIFPRFRDMDHVARGLGIRLPSMELAS